MPWRRPLAIWWLSGLTGQTFQTVLGLAFIAMAGWALVPDKEASAQTRSPRGHLLGDA